MLNNGTKVTYRYNANGMRTQKKVGSKVTDYYYDSNNNLIAQKTDNATYEKYESGELNIRISVLVALREIYDCKYDDFFEGLVAERIDS